MVSHGYATSCGFGCDPVCLGGVCVGGDGGMGGYTGGGRACVSVGWCVAHSSDARGNDGLRDERRRWRASGSSPAKTWRLRGITRRPSRGSLPRKCNRQTGDHIVRNTTHAHVQPRAQRKEDAPAETSTSDVGSSNSISSGKEAGEGMELEGVATSDAKETPTKRKRRSIGKQKLVFLELVKTYLINSTTLNLICL
jgi:hypothetical protein